MKLQTEQYKGYPVKFVEKILKGKNGESKLVVGEYPSKVTNRMLGAQGSTKEVAFNKVKKMIDTEVKKLGE